MGQLKQELKFKFSKRVSQEDSLRKKVIKTLKKDKFRFERTVDIQTKMLADALDVEEADILKAVNQYTDRLVLGYMIEKLII